MTPGASVVVLTCTGPQRLRACLGGLAGSNIPPLEVVVVDGSAQGRLTELLAPEFPEVRVVRNPAGPRARRHARRIGAAAATGEIVAFIDDDAVPDHRWLETLVSHFTDPDVVGAGGRLVSREPGQRPRNGLPGRVLADGRLTADFRVDTARPASVHHLSGVNMSFRRAALGQLSGQEYPGTAQWEDADLCWQARAGGGTLIFDPSAVVHYEPGRPRVGGKRRRRPARRHYAIRNNVALLLRHSKWGGAGVLRHFVSSTLRAQFHHLFADTRSVYLGDSRARARFGPADVVVRLALVSGEVSGLLLGLIDGLIHSLMEKSMDKTGFQ